MTATLILGILDWLLKVSTAIWDRVKKPVEKVKAKRNEILWDKRNIQNVALKTLMWEVNADRAFVATRHNGAKDWRDKSLQKLSIVIEVIRDPVFVKPKRHYFKDVLLTEIIWWWNAIRNNRMIYWDTDDLIQDDAVTYAHMFEWGVKSVVCAPIFDRHFMDGKEPIGFICFEWIQKKAPNFCDIYGTPAIAYKKLTDMGESIKHVL